MILIVAEPGEPTAVWIHDLLLQRGHLSKLVDLGCFPVYDSIVFRHSNAVGHDVVYLQRGAAIPLGDVRSIYWRRPGLPRADAQLEDAAVVEHIEESSAEVIHSIFDDLACLQFPCTRHVLRRAHWKLPQLTLAAKLGFNIPETLVTNDPKAFLDFVNEAKSKVITKPAAAHDMPPINDAVFGYANLVRPRDLARYQDVRLCPFIAQRYIEKKLELRVTVVGPDVFAAEIHSQDTNRTKTDWRHYDDGNTPYFVHQLPHEIAELCRAIVQAMGLLYGAIDLILTPHGQYFFLEINPAGQFGWIEQMTGLPISQRIVKMLVEHA